MVTERNFERFHRRFISFGLGSTFAYFVIKSLSTMFCHGTYICCEILSRLDSEGIEENHPKNPAKILSNISESFLEIY